MAVASPLHPMEYFAPKKFIGARARTRPRWRVIGPKWVPWTQWTPLRTAVLVRTNNSPVGLTGAFKPYPTTSSKYFLKKLKIQTNVFLYK